MTKMFTKYWVLYLIFFVSTVIQYSYCGFAKKYRMSIQNIVACPDNDKVENPLRNLKYVKINSTHGLLTYNITNKRPLDEHIWAHLRIEKFSEQGWVQIPLFPPQRDACSSCLNSPAVRDFWIMWASMMHVKEPKKCPVPAGDYWMKEGLVDMSLIRKIPMWAGKYRVLIIQWYKKPENRTYCLEINFDTEEVID